MVSSDQPSTPRPRRPGAAVIVASLALVVAAAPPAYAAVKANSVGTRQIVDGSVSNVDIRPSAINSGRVADASLALADLSESARWRKTIAGSWSFSEGVVVSIAASPAVTTMGSLSSGGSGVLRLGRPARVLVDGAVLVQNQSGATRTIACNVVVGSAILVPNTTALVLNGSSTTLAVSASKDVSAGTYDVSVTCSTPTAITAGNVHVNVVTVPLN